MVTFQGFMLITENLSSFNVLNASLMHNPIWWRQEDILATITFLIFDQMWDQFNHLYYSSKLIWSESLLKINPQKTETYHHWEYTKLVSQALETITKQELLRCNITLQYTFSVITWNIRLNFCYLSSAVYVKISCIRLVPDLVHSSS